MCSLRVFLGILQTDTKPSLHNYTRYVWRLTPGTPNSSTQDDEAGAEVQVQGKPEGHCVPGGYRDPVSKIKQHHHQNQKVSQVGSQ